MFLIITLLCSVQSEFIIESLIQTDRLSTYNPQWQQRFMDRQTADNDLLAAAKQAQSFNDNLEHEVRVASNLEPIQHLGEFPTKLKMDSSRDATQINTSKLDQKLQQMKEQIAEESVFKIGWQDDDKLYNKVIEHLIELDPEEQADFLLQVLKNEMRSNRTRVVQRLHGIVQMIMDDILLVPLEKLYEITIRANMEMEIEEVFKEDLNLSLDPIRNGEIGEVEQLVEELQYDESNIIVEEENIQHQLPIEYQIVLRKEPKLKDYNHLNPVQSIPINQVHVVNEQQIENKNIQKIKRIRLDDFFIVKNDDGGEEIVENGGEEVINNNSEEQQQQQEGGEEQQQMAGNEEQQQQQDGSNEEQQQQQTEEQQQQEGSGEEQQQQQTEEQQQYTEEQQQQYQELPEPGPGELFRNPQIPFTQEYQQFIPHEYFNPIHRDDNYEQQYIPLTQEELNYQQRPIIPHEIFNPINEDDKYNVYGDKPKKVDPYFHYTHGNKTTEINRQEDVAQSINIVQGTAEMQSINIVMDPPEIQSINIQFDETQAEQYKQQQLYHKYRNQEHFINRGSFHYPNNPEYPNIHTVNQPSPYYYDGYYTGEVPTHQYQEYEPKVEEPQIDEGAFITEEIIQEFVNPEEIIIQGEEAAVEAIPEEGANEGGGEGGEAGNAEGGEGGDAGGEEKGETGGEEKGEAGGEEKGEAGGEEKGEAGGEEKGETTGEANAEEKEQEAQPEEKEQEAQPEENNEIPNQTEETVNPPPEESSSAALPEETLSPPPEETSNTTQDETPQIEEQFVPSNQINWENIPDEEIEYLLSRLIHPRFYDPYHPDYDPNDPRNIVFLEEHQKRSLIYLQVKHPLFYLPGEGPYSKLRACTTPEDLLDQITQQDIQQLVAEWKRRNTKSNTKQSIYRPFSLDPAPIKQNTYEPRDPPKRKKQSTTEPVEIDDKEFVTPRDIGKFGKKRSNQQQQYDPNDPRSLPNFNPDSFQGNNEYRSDNPILKVVQGSKLQPEERGDYQELNPDEFHKPPAFDDDRPYRTDRDGKIKKDDYWDDYDEIYDYDDEYYDEDYMDYDDYGDYDDYDREPRYKDRDPRYKNREPRHRNRGRRYRDRDGDGIPDRYQYPPYYRRRPYDDDYDYDDYEGPPRETDERQFERELDRTRKGMRKKRHEDEIVSEYHVYHDIDQYKKERDDNDKRNREEKAQQHPKYKPGNMNGSPRIRDTTEDIDDYPRREIGEDKDEMDTSGIAFAKSLKEQERQKQNKKKSKQKLKERGISDEDNSKQLSKNKNTQKQKISDDNKSDDNNNNNNNQQQQNNNNQQQQQNDNETPKQQQNYQVKGLAANKSNNVNNSDSLIKPQNKETTKKEMSKANELPEPDLKHQAKNNAEKNDENKSLGKNEEPLLNKKTKSLLQMSDESCQQMDSRSKTYTCVQCNANKSHRLNDDTWYLIGLAKGYKKEFHTIFKLIKELINPQQLYTSFGQENQICFSSQEKQKVNIQRIIQLFNGKEIKNTLIPIPNELMMSYFQLQYRNGTFNDFELDIDDNTIQIEKSGIKISKINIIWHNDQIQINKQGTLNIENLQRKFEHKQIIQNDCISENLRMYLHFPHDYQLSINMMKQLFNDVTYYTDYLLSQVNKDRWIIIQYKQRICDDLHEYGITLT